MSSRLRRRAVAALMASALAALALPTKASLILYSESSNVAGTPDTGILFHDDLGTSSGDADATDQDNVNVPSLLSGQSLEVDKVESEVRSRDGSLAPTLSAFYSILAADPGPNPGGSDPIIAAPPTSFGSASLSASADNGTGTVTTSSEPLTIGDGVIPLSPAQIIFTGPLIAGTTGGALVADFKIDAIPDPRDNVNLQGARPAPPDTDLENPVEFFKFIPPSSQRTFAFVQPWNTNERAALSMTITDSLILTPEPGSLSLAALGGLVLLARRPSRIGN